MPPSPFLLWLFWRWSLANYLLGLALNCDLPNLSFPNSKDYRDELPAPGCPEDFGKQSTLVL
jgi:hypothetical protein